VKSGWHSSRVHGLRSWQSLQAVCGVHSIVGQAALGGNRQPATASQKTDGQSELTLLQ